MPLQTIFTDKVTKVGTTQLYPLGTERIEGNKIYKYMKSGGTVDANAALQASAAGTVVLFAGVGPGCGFNSTGSALAANDYFWMQVHGEVADLNTDGITAVGMQVGITDADGVTIADPTTGITAFGNCTCAVKHASAGVIYLSGLA